MTADLSLADLRNVDVLRAAQALEDAHNPGDGSWGDHPDHPRSEWQREASEGGTQVGYWVWVVGQLDMADTEDTWVWTISRSDSSPSEDDV